MAWKDGRPEPHEILEFRRVRDQFPDELLEPYWGKQVAWRNDGKAIVASGETDEELDKRLQELGIAPGTVFYEFIHHPDVSYF